MKRSKLNPSKFQGSMASQIEELERDPEFIAEALALAFAESILELMHKKGISQVELAEKMGVSPAFVSRIFNAPPNLTLKSISKIALALGVVPQIGISNNSSKVAVNLHTQKRMAQ